MGKIGQPLTILMADDDADDRLLTQEALEEARLVNYLHFVEDGEQLMEICSFASRPHAGTDLVRPEHAEERRP